MVDTSLSQANILIVDDDPNTLVALQELLQGVAHRVVTASSGEDALRRVLKQDFAAVLLDARMPGMDGFETARLIREREQSRHTPIIFLTGAFEDVHSVFRGYEAGAVDYIVKPLVPEILRSKISVFVELYNKNAVLIREIAERKRAGDHLRKSEENLRALAAHLQLVRAMGLWLDTTIKLTDRLQYDPADGVTVADARTEALKHRSDLRAQQEKESTSRLMASSVRMERVPTLGSFVDYGTTGTTDSALTSLLPTTNTDFRRRTAGRPAG